MISILNARDEKCLRFLLETYLNDNGGNMIKAVIFDMDGLMIDTEKLLVKYWLEAARYYGYSMNRNHIIGIRSMEPKHAASKLRAEIGQDFDYYKVRSLRKKLMNEHIGKYGLEEKKGLGELLNYLKLNHYLTAVATSTDYERTSWYLSSLGRMEYFDVIVCADMVKNGKPEPDIYLEAAERLKTEPGMCMALEDSPNGILSAYRAGMRPVMIPDLSQPDEKTEKLLFRCVEDLSKVIPLLELEME